MDESSVKAERKVIGKCFTCPICNKFFVDATTIIECIHTFCRKCIRDKITAENLKACPVCQVDLGANPLEKLRTDNIWLDLRSTIFPPKPATKKHKAKKKKKTVSSVLAAPSRVSTSADQSNTDDAPLEPEKLTEKVEDVPQIQSSSRPLVKYRRRQRKNPMPKRFNDIGLEPDIEQDEGENDFEIVLNIEQDNGLAGAGASEVCNGTAIIVEPAKSLNSKQNHVSGGDTDDEVSGEVNQNTLVIISDGETEEIFGEQPKKNAKENQESSVRSSCDKKQKGKAYSPPVLRSRKTRNVDSAGTSQNAISKEVWFTLAALKNQHSNRPLPEIPTLYFKCNGNLPVSYVKKLVAKKLNLDSKDEVEIWLRKEPLCSSQLLHTVLDWWIETTPIFDQRSAMIGNSGEEFVMKLNYSRSHLYP
ncbi:unnamed protein product [Arabis nemorensis]|uniref:RING-type domain-containing protein n=1 Tax=Arabis nemorensis TaxID=586526 RepID=A0A565BAG4_9BRAS|nr:unnamed protein product [Arabis nemorensis]